MVDSDDMLTRRFLLGRRRAEMGVRERAVLEDSVVDVRTIPPRTTFVARGERVTHSCLLLEGWVSRYRDSAEGERQSVCIHVPGDFVDLHGFPLSRLDHDIATITQARIAIVPHDRLSRIVADCPGLTRSLWFATLLDAAMHREWIFRIGQMGGAERVAHLICELHVRLEAVGLAGPDGFDFPLTQQDVGEACGLTNVHVNRVVAVLRRRGLVTIGRRRVDIQDIAGLRALAQFDPHYLYLDDYHAR